MPSIDTLLQLVQTVALGLLWLFFIGRWVGKQDAHASDAPAPITSLLNPAPAPPPDHAPSIARIDDELQRTRDRIHKLEGFRGIAETRLNYIERALDRKGG